MGTGGITMTQAYGTNRSITRRLALRGLAALGLGAVGLTGWACVAPAPSTSPTPPAAASATPGPAASAGVIRLAVDTLGFGFVPTNTSLRFFFDPVFDNIVGTKPNGDEDPNAGFAKSWQVSADNKTWTFKVRDDVVFHNGDKATARDVQFTIEFARRPNSLYASAAQLRTDVARIDVPDDQTLVVHLNNPDVFFHTRYLSNLGNTMLNYLLPKAYIEAKGEEYFNQNPIGSGPYKVSKIDVNQSLQYASAGKHWLYGTPAFQSTQWQLVPEESTRVSLLKTGKADVINISRQGVADLQKSGFNLFEKKDSYVALLQINQQWMEGNPLSVVKVRQALDAAIDRQAICDTFLLGQATPTVDFPVMSWDYAYKPHPVTSFDVSHAKQLLSDGGYPNGFDLDMYIYMRPGLPEAPDIMENIATNWEKAGVKVTRKPIAFDTYRGMWGENSFTRPSLAGLSFYANGPITVGASSWLRKEGQFKLSADDELDQLTLKQIAATSRDAYIAAGQQLEQRVLDKSALPAIFQTGDHWATRADLKGPWELGRGGYSINVNQLTSGR